MRRLDLLYNLLRCMAMCCLTILVGCTESTSAPTYETPITFGNGMNRANTSYVNIPDDQVNATLWGYKDGSNDTKEWVFGENSSGLDARIESDGNGVTSLTPEGDSKLWNPGNYYFVSTWPNVSGSTVSLSGEVHIPNYNLSNQTADGWTDLRLATVTADGSDYIANTNSIELNYKRLLTKIIFKGKSSSNVPATLNRLSLTIPSTASYSATNVFANELNGSWEVENSTCILTYNNSETGWKLSNSGTIVTEVYVFPQIVNSQSIPVEINIPDAGITSTKSGYIPATTWQAGKQYTYTFTIDEAGGIFFDEPTITPWGEASAGPTIVF